MIKSGLAFHCHHDKLFEYVYDYDERVRFIKRDKPKDERKLRLKLFKIIPLNKLPADLGKAGTAYDKATTACGKARTACDKAWAVCDKAEATFDRAWAVCDKAWAACDKLLIKHNDYFIKLHKELCPNCPWDGETIFPKSRE